MLTGVRNLVQSFSLQSSGPDSGPRARQSNCLCLVICLRDVSAIAETASLLRKAAIVFCPRLMMNTPSPLLPEA